MKQITISILSLATVMLASVNANADDKPDESTKVTATIILPKDLTSFADHTLELQLYEYDPRLADAGANLVEAIEKPKFSHTSGKPTELKIEIGAAGKIKPERSYYLTMFILNGTTRTHIGERDGKQGLCKVITNGEPREVKLLVRNVR
jgi:hypothetical protein